MPTIGEQLKALRIKKGMTQEQLAQKLGTTKAAISRYEKNQRQPKLEVLTEIAMILGANPDELFNLYFQSESLQDENGDRGTHYFGALSNWMQTVLPGMIRESSGQILDEWLTELDSPFALYHVEELAVVKKLIEAISALDKVWREELLEDATRYLEFQEQKKAKIEKLKRDVK